MSNALPTWRGACHCGAVRFEVENKRVTPDHLGINVHCLEGFDPAGIPVRQAVGAAMP